MAHETPATATTKHPLLTNAEPPPKASAGHKFKLPTPDEMGVTEACQQAVRDNPGALRIELMRAMEALGYKMSSLSSIFGLLHTQKIIRADKEGHLWANYKRYRPVMGRAAWAQVQKKAKKSAGRPGLPKPHKNGRTNGMTYADSARLGGKASQTAKKLGMKVGAADRPMTASVADKRDSIAYALYARWTKDPLPYEKWLAQRGKTAAPKYVVSRSTRKPQALGKSKPAAKPQDTKTVAPALDKGAAKVDPSRSAVLTIGPNLADLSPTQVVNGMSVAQAYSVFKVLRTMFKE